MDQMKKLSRETQVVLGCAVLFLIISFFDWQQVSFSSAFVSGAVGLNLWHGIGFVAGLLVIALLIWETVRLLEVNTPTGNVTEGHISVALALALALFTVIAFFDKSTARHWPAWIGLILSLVIAAAAVMRARAEGVQLPQAKAASPAAESTTPAEPAVAPTEAAAPAEPAVKPEPPEDPAASAE
jgi:signal transduction histidine kinase